MASHAKMECEIHDEKLDELQKELAALLGGLQHSERRQQDLDDCTDKLQSFENSLTSLRVELGSLETNDKKVFQKKCRDYDKVYEKYANEVEWQRSLSVKSELLEGGEENKSNLDTAAGMMAQGRSTRGESKESLSRTLGVIAATATVGKDTLVQLDSQQQQLEGVGEDLGSIGGTLRRTNKVIQRIGRKMMTDKLLWVIVFLVIAAIIAVIVYKTMYDKNAPVNVPDGFHP